MFMLTSLKRLSLFVQYQICIAVVVVIVWICNRVNLCICVCVWVCLLFYLYFIFNDYNNKTHIFPTKTTIQHSRLYFVFFCCWFFISIQPLSPTNSHPSISHSVVFTHTHTLIHSLFSEMTSTISVLIRFMFSLNISTHNKIQY